ncbi:MAG: LacI family transcriptional regulator [Victivallaceae bacterium]|nr:LacI family transcriptional regulator [Victivallaceae bacterium]
MQSVINIREVATMAGVSPATVSRVMNGKNRLRTAAAQRVKEIIDQTGYVRKKQQAVAGTILCFYEQGEILTQHAGALLHLLDERCHLAKLRLVNIRSSKHAPIETLIAENKVVGVIYLSGHKYKSDILLPAVELNSYEAYQTYSSVDCDDFSGVVDSLRYLREQGHSRIAYFCDREINRAENILPRVAALPAAYHAAGVDYDGTLICQEDFAQNQHHEVIAAALDRWLALPEQPTAIVMTGDAYAASFYGLLAERGLKIPEDISIIGFDDDDQSKMVYPQLTTVSKPLEKMADMAMNILVNAISGNDNGLMKVLIKPQLIIRDSVRKID